MKTYGVLGQFGWYLFGVWAGAAFCLILSVIQSPDTTPWTKTGPDILLWVVACGPASLLWAIPYATWLFISRRWLRRRIDFPWVLALFAGLTLLPAFGFVLPLLIRATGHGQGTLIGTAVFTYLFGIPIAHAEICARIANLGRGVPGSSEDTIPNY